MPPDGSYLLGIGEQRFVRGPARVWLTPQLAASHLLVVGRTGSGKTKLLEALCRQFLDTGQPFALLDLHGDLAASLRDYAAEAPDCWPKLLWLDAADPDRTATFNPLIAGRPAQAPTQVLELVAAMKRNWSDSWGPRLENLVTESMTVLQANGLTLCELPLLLGDRAVRDRLLGHPRVSPTSRDYFYLRFNALAKRDQVMVSESTMNKVGALLSDVRVRTLVGDTKPTLVPREVLARGDTVLARIPRGALVENADLVASLLLAAFHTAALARVELPPAKRRPYVLVLDEAQVASETFPQLLSGARAFGLSAVCGLQYLEMVPRNLSEALLANCRVRVAFAVGRRDAERLARELFVSDGDHVKHRERDLLGTKKSRPTYWSVQEEVEYQCRELMQQRTGECVIALDREPPWFTETVPVRPAHPGEAAGALSAQLQRRTRSRRAVARAISARRQELFDQPLTTHQGGDDHDDTIETLAPL